MSVVGDNSLPNNPQDNKESLNSEREMSLIEYKQWTDELLSDSESLQKARDHTPGKIYRRTDKKVT